MDLLERDCFLDELSELLRQASAGRGHALFLGGEAGVGKTALVQRFCKEVPATTRVFSGSCDPLSTPRPLGPLLDIAAELGGELGKLVSAAAARHRLFSAFLAELDRGRAPTLAVIEDVHWADEASLDLLRFLGRRLGQTRGMVIATYRDDEVGPAHPLKLVLGDLATATAVRRLVLPPLSAEAVRMLAGGINLDPVALHRHTGGNPFFITEVLATGAPGIPSTVRDAVLARTARLSMAGRIALDAAAVIGSPIECWLLTDVADTTTQTMEECIATGMLRWEGAALVFRHELAREAVLQAIAPPRRIELHARVLAALRTANSPNLAQLAHHADEAGDRDAVLTYAPAAAERAASLRAHREAAAQYARTLRFADGLSLEERGALLEARSYECYLADQASEGVAACEAALDTWRQAGDRLREGDTLRRLSRLFWFSRRNVEAREAARTALDVLEALPVGPELAMAYSNWSQLCMLAWDTEEALAEAQSLFELTAPRNLPLLNGELAFWLWRGGSHTSAPPGAFEPFSLQIAGKWSEAAARWRAHGCPYETAWALADSGEESSLRLALDEFRRLGAAPAAAMIERRLRRMGARGIARGPRPTTRANPALLTRWETQILELIAEGRRNAEIADRLFLSSRTVAHHVTAILAKLGVDSRTEAAREAARLGIAGQLGTSTSPK